MRPDELAVLLQRRPFVPIRLYMSDGTTYGIRHPETYILVRSYIAVAVKARPQDLVSERIMFCSLVHIVRAEDITVQAEQKV